MKYLSYVVGLAVVLGALPVLAQKDTGQTPSASVAKRAVTAAAPSLPAPADIAKELTEKVERWTSGQFKVAGVRTTPIPDMFEVQIRTDLFFVDRTGRFIIVEGEMIDMATDANLSRARMAEVLAINFKDLPLAKAIKQVNGNGQRVVALFEDPNCAYCRRLRADLMKIDNLTVYTFAYPILAADSDLKSRKALCAPDTNKAWNDLMLSGLVPSNDGKCDNPLDEFIGLGKQYGISATPTMFFPSGHRLQGYAPPTRFVELLESNQKPKS